LRLEVDGCDHRATASSNSHTYFATYRFPRDQRTDLRLLEPFWVFGGFLIIATGITGLPVLKNFRGALLLVILPIIAALSTALLLWRTPHRQR